MPVRMRRHLVLACLLAPLLAEAAPARPDHAPPLPPAPAVPGQTLVLGVHPYLPADELERRFAPLARYLEHGLGRSVAVRVGASYAEHIEALGRGEVDIAYLGPMSYVKAVQRFGRFPLLARQVVNGDPFLRGAIVVRQDSPYQRLSDLKGRCVALGDPESTMSYILPRRALEHDGVPLESLARFEQLEGHRNVAMAVLSGDCDAGAVKGEVLDAYASKGLRALATMPPVHDHLFVARAALPDAQVERVRALLLALERSAEGQAAMRSIHPGMTALVRAQDADYDSLRALIVPAPTANLPPADAAAHR